MRARRVVNCALVEYAKSSCRDVRGLLRGHSSTEQVAQVREDVRAVVTSWLMRHESTRLEECTSHEVVTENMEGAKCARTRVANSLPREELFVRPAAGTRGTDCTYTLSVLGRSRSCARRDEPGGRSRPAGVASFDI